MKKQFFDAIRAGNRDEVERLLLLDSSLIHAREKSLSPVLACFFGHLEAAEYLVRAGASINTPSNNELQATPLQSAVSGRHPPIVETLLKNGAQPNVRERGGNTPLHAAAANDDIKSIEFLIFAGADLHIRNDNGKRAIDLAIEKGNRQAEELLKREITRRFRPVFDR